jgi:excisionase family DNA binding protein
MAIPRPTSAGAAAMLADRSTAQDSDAALHELLTVDDVALLLKVSKSWVYEHTRSRGRPRSDQLPHIKVGKYVRFDPYALRRFIEKKCRTA